MKYVQTIEDSKLWKDQFEDSIKGRAKMVGDYYVLEQGGKGENTQYIPQVEEDIIKAKGRISKYKRQKNTNTTQMKVKRRRRRKGIRKKKNIRRKVKNGRIKKKRRQRRKR